MKKNKIFGIIGFSLAALCVGGTFAAYTITDSANPIGAKITLEPQVETFTKIYYQSSFFFGGEGTVYAYAWDSTNGANKNADYPGIPMTAEDYKHGLYSYEVSDKYDKVIFNAGNLATDPTKTPDLTINRTNVYYCQHQNAWDASLDDCTFSYYLTGVLSGVSGWGNKSYNYGLLKNYSGGNVDEYMTVDYAPKKNDEFKAIDSSGTYYGMNGSSAGDSANFKVLQNNSANKTVQVYFAPNSTLYAGVNYYYKDSNPGSNGTNWWCHQWPDGGSGTTWSGNPMTRDGEGGQYWYYANVPLYYDCVIFNNKGSGGNGNVQTNDLKGIDISKPYYNGSSWSASK